MTKYHRVNGPIGYETPLFWRADTGTATDVAQRLLRVPLAWWWESEQRDGSAVRSLTRLESANANELVADIAERDDDNFGRRLVIYGVRPLEDFSPHDVTDAMSRFSEREDGDVEIVIVQPGDHASELVFVPHTLSPAISSFFTEFEILPDAPEQTKPYKDLRAASLERLLGLAQPSRRRME